MNTLKTTVLFLVLHFAFTSLEATRLVTYKFRGQERAGAWLEDGIVDLNRGYLNLLAQSQTPRAEAKAEALVPPAVLELLRGQWQSLAAAKEAIAHVKQVLAEGGKQGLKDDGVLFEHSEVELLAPLPNPPHILAIGLNYRAHAEETGNEIPEYPTVFTKEGKVIGPGESIEIPHEVERADYEVELAFVISKPATRVSQERALDYVAGYMTFNDVSARDIQGRVSQWTLGKSVDTFSVMGP
ncbi:MAG: fumarylacetoacetate hydrolase family protein, partial [Acidobacteriota bacterium]